jgi:hypothetical protein
LPSLDDCNSLPHEFNGIPLTSVRQQEIGQVLAKLSKCINVGEEKYFCLLSSSAVFLTSAEFFDLTDCLILFSVEEELLDVEFKVPNTRKSQAGITYYCGIRR